MQIDCDFESGSIQVLDASDPSAVKLSLRGDNASDFKQWFHFRVSGALGVPCAFQIVDASQSSFPEGWTDYRACASYDGESWFRVPTEYDGEALTIRHTPEREGVSYACYVPYPRARHEELLEQARRSQRSLVIELG